MEKSKRRSIAIRTKNGCLVVLSFKEKEQKDWKKKTSVAPCKLL
ncbi:MAG: hypothetical protein ACI4KO_09795 [Ruminiclostridium sp.]